MTNESKKTFRSSIFPSPSLSARMTIRPTGASSPVPKVSGIYPSISANHIRPRLSNVIATGATANGSDATSSTSNPSSTTIDLIAAWGLLTPPSSWPLPHATYISAAQGNKKKNASRLNTGCNRLLFLYLFISGIFTVQTKRKLLLFANHPCNKYLSSPSPLIKQPRYHFIGVSVWHILVSIGHL